MIRTYQPRRMADKAPTMTRPAASELSAIREKSSMKPLEFTTVKPLEFTTVSVEEARRALEGEPTKPGASQLTVKRTQTPKEPLLDVARTWLASLPADIPPLGLAR